MTTIRSSSGLEVALNAGRTFFHQQRNQLQVSWARHKVYRKTYEELSALSDRDLHDLGIARGNIKQLAMETAHDL